MAIRIGGDGSACVPKCGKRLEAGWNVCPSCSTPIPEARKEWLQYKADKATYRRELYSSNEWKVYLSALATGIVAYLVTQVPSAFLLLFLGGLVASLVLRRVADKRTEKRYPAQSLHEYCTLPNEPA